MRFKDELNFSDRNWQTWAGHRSNTTCSHHYLFHVQVTVFWSYLVMGHELGSATDIHRLLVASGLSTPIFTLIGKYDFWSFHVDFVGQKCRKKLVILSFHGCLSAKSSRILKTVWTCVCAVERRPVFQFSSPYMLWLTSFDSRKIYPLFDWPSSSGNIPSQ